MPDLPFQVGELIESKSFQPGYRGAWFRSKIRDIGMKGADLRYLLEYPDYPDNKMTWIKLYQKPKPARKNSKNYRELVVRPRFPTIHHESEKVDVNAISEVVVIVDDTWKVGDLVDWFTDGCYWCGTVSEVLGDGEVKIDLLPYPLGEGSSYTVPSKDLRPSLDWIPEKGWTVPMPMEDRSGHPCARIINPTKSGGSIANKHARDGTAKVGQPTVGISLSLPRNSDGLLESSDRFEERSNQCNSVRNGGSIANKRARDGTAKVGQATVGVSLNLPRNSDGLLESSDRFEERSEQCNSVRNGGSIANKRARDGTAKVGQPTVGISLHLPQNSDGLLESSDGFKERSKQCNSVSNGMDIDKSDMSMSIENLESATTNSGNNNEYPPAKKMRSSGLCLNSMSSNTVEAAILDLEELVNRIKWLKGVLKMRVPLPGIKPSSWKFLHHHAPCK